jgi:endo-1,4-beta-xylanase
MALNGSAAGTLLGASIWLTAASLSGAQEPIEFPDGGSSMLPADWLGAARVAPANNSDLATSETIEVDGMSFDRAMRVTVLKRPDNPWNVLLAVQTAGPIEKGDVCLLSFWARGPQSENESGDALARAFLQRNRAPHEKLLQALVSANRQWRQVVVSGRAGLALPDGGSNVVLHLGYHPQTVEIADIRLINYGQAADPRSMPGLQETYEGRSPDAPWRKEAAQRIDQIRKAEMAVKVVNADGQPIAGAKVDVNMRRHAFGFGSAVVARMLCDESEDGRKYREVVERCYTKVVFENDLKWGPWELGASNTDRTYRREWTDQALAWLNERDIEVRGHYITWAPLDKGRAKYVGRPDELRRDLFAHMEDKVPTVGERVGEWDAINHIVGWGDTMASETGGPAIYAEIMRRSRQLAPHVELWVNEGQVLPSGQRRQAYEEMVRYLIDQGAAPDGIGFMGHFGRSSLTPPAEIYAVLDRFAAIIPKLQLTEFDVQVGEDEELQADYLRDVMTVAFSHPAIEAIVMWGFWEGRLWKPDTALYRRDWSLKPAGEAWNDLVLGQWWTEETGETDAEGQFATRGFLGEYAVTVTHGNKSRTVEASLSREGATVQVGLE